jgi:hypothetical protein
MIDASCHRIGAPPSQQRMAALRSAAEHAAYMAEIKTRFRRKRNFIALLG